MGPTIGPGLAFVLEPVETQGPLKYIDLLESPSAGPFSNANTILN